MIMPSNVTRSISQSPEVRHVRSPSRLRVTFVFFTALLILANPTVAQDVDDAVEAGRNALEDTGQYPWYDSAADDLRRINVQNEQVNNTRTTAFGGGDWFTPLAWISIALMLALLGYLLVRVYLVREAAKTNLSKAEEENIGDQIDRIENLPVTFRKQISDLLAEARRHYDGGNYAEAVIFYYSHLLVQLDRRQLIRLAKGKTNRQYLREVSGRTGLIDLLGETMLMFEDVFFGRQNLSRDHFDTVWRRRDEFETLLEHA